jgi:hypothetical protein
MVRSPIVFSRKDGYVCVAFREKTPTTPGIIAYYNPAYDQAKLHLCSHPDGGVSYGLAQWKKSAPETIQYVYLIYQKEQA